jgi:signal transduction histidine kinase
LSIARSSLNSEAIQSGEAVLVNNVAEDPRFLADESLPDTRSELVVPLSVSGRLIGTLDVQSTRVNAFAEDDVLVIQSLGDQIAVAIENARLVGRSRELAVMEERNRMARELHDSMTQLLYSLVLFAGAGRKAVQAERLDRAERHLIRVEGSAQQALKEMRLLVFELRPHTLDDEGLAGALRQRLDAVENRVGITTQLSVEGRLDLPAATEEGLYRIAQEALTNALRHAFASTVQVLVDGGPDAVTLEVIDDGCGFDPAGRDGLGGLGLVSMRERAEELGATLTINSAPGAGTRVKVTVGRERDENGG